VPVDFAGSVSRRIQLFFAGFEANKIAGSGHAGVKILLLVSGRVDWSWSWLDVRALFVPAKLVGSAKCRFPVTNRLAPSVSAMRGYSVLRPKFGGDKEMVVRG
jgi:hypothetical protein